MKNVVYNQGLNTIDLVSVTGHFLLTFCAIFFDVPALIWYGWLQVLSELGMCEDGMTILMASGCSLRSVYYST